MVATPLLYKPMVLAMDPSGIMNPLMPVRAALAQARRVSMQRKTRWLMCWAEAPLWPYQASLVWLINRLEPFWR